MVKTLYFPVVKKAIMNMDGNWTKLDFWLKDVIELPRITAKDKKHAIDSDICYLHPIPTDDIIGDFHKMPYDSLRYVFMKDIPLDLLKRLEDFTKQNKEVRA